MQTELITRAVSYLRRYPNTYLATVDGDEPAVRAMYAARVDDDGAIWYATGLDTAKVRHLRQNPRVCVAVYAEGGDLRLFGTAEVISDPARKAELWEEAWALYFVDADDPNYGLIKVTPTRVELI